MKRTPIKRVSTKRAAQLREYSKLRKQFLIDHPFCEFWMAERGIRSLPDLVARGICVMQKVPLATEIHHKNKRHGARLNDTSQWMAVSREAHLWIEGNKKEARLRGYLMDI